MKPFEIRYYPDPVLKKTTQVVTEFNKELSDFTERMLLTMYQADGIGLAAPQIGDLKRVAVIDVSEKQDSPLILINPKIIANEGKVDSYEGCLSIPDYRETIQRSRHVKVVAQDMTGKEFEVATDGLLSQALQHEIDHLDGILFIDRLSRLKRELFRRWLKKQLSA